MKWTRGDFQRSAALCGLCIHHVCTAAYIKQSALLPLHTELLQQIGAEALSSADTGRADSDLLEVARQISVDLIVR